MISVFACAVAFVVVSYSESAVEARSWYALLPPSSSVVGKLCVGSDTETRWTEETYHCFDNDLEAQSTLTTLAYSVK